MASLEAHLDSVKASFGLNADKLDYNYRVLGGWVGRGVWLGGTAGCRILSRVCRAVRMMWLCTAALKLCRPSLASFCYQPCRSPCEPSPPSQPVHPST